MRPDNTVSVDINLTKSGDGAKQAGSEVQEFIQGIQRTAAVLAVVLAAGEALKAMTGGLASMAAGVLGIILPKVAAISKSLSDSKEEIRAKSLKAAWDEMEQGLTSASVRGGESRIQQIDREYSHRLATIERLKVTKTADGTILLADPDATEKANQAIAKRLEALNKFHKDGKAEADQLGKTPRELEKFKINNTYDEKLDKLTAYYETEERLATTSEERFYHLEEEKTEKMKLLMEQREAALSVYHSVATAVGKAALDKFSSGFSTAFMAFVQGTKSASQAFREFAVSFLQQIAQMIVQQLIFNTLKAALGSTKLGGFFGLAEGGLVPSKAAHGAVILAAAGTLAGVQEVAAATYFPSHNVIAGEAGREMMAVFARPQSINLGGINAITGSVQGNRLAMLNERDLARLTSVRNPVSYAAGGMVVTPDLSTSSVFGGGSASGVQPQGLSGRAVIEVRGTRDFEARLVESSVKGAVLEVENKLQETDSTLTKSVKNINA